MRITYFARLFTVFCVSCAALSASLHAQDAPAVATTLPQAKPSSEGTVIIEADQNSYIGTVATADGNVVIRYKDTVLYADHAIMDRTTKLVHASGNVRIFSNSNVYRGSVVSYNMDTKAMVSSSFLGEEYPKLVSGQKVTTPGTNHYRLINGSFTTNNREHPSYHLQAGTIEYRPNDEVVLKNVLVYIGDVPVMYIPIVVQSLNDSRPTYQFQIGQAGNFGAFMDNKYNWVADTKLRGTVNFDIREKRGYAGGVDVQYFPTTQSDILLKTYYAQDNFYTQHDPSSPNSLTKGNLNNNYVYDGVPYDNRYRVDYEHHLQFSPDLSSIADLNFWSDPWVTRDFFPGEYQQENQPPNFVALNYYNPSFTVDLLTNPQVNPFFETVVRLPEFGIETKQQKIFNSDVEWLSQSSMVNFQRKFADVSNFSYPTQYIYNSFPGAYTNTAYAYYHPNANYTYNTNQENNYAAFRYDTFQEFSYPKQYFNFLSLTPRIGGRLTYYSDTNQDITDTYNNSGQSSAAIYDSKLRIAGEVGLAGSFKISRTWLNVSNPSLGIDGLRHVVEPFFDAQYAPQPNVTPNEIRGFDDRLYSTQLQPIRWNEYNSIDSIDKQAVVRFGVWNKIQTKHDGVNYDLMTIQTYMDADFDHNFSAATPNSTMSDLFNDIHFYITPQLQFDTFTAIAVNSGGYNQMDADLTWSPDPSLKFGIGDHYINHSSIFSDSNSVSLQMFYRMNEHWQFQAQESFEAVTGTLQQQQYTVYRDLDSWQLALSFAQNQLNGVADRSIFFSLTLKAFPQYQLHTPRL